MERYQSITAKDKTIISWWTQWNTVAKGGDCKETSGSKHPYWLTLTASGFHNARCTCIFRIQIWEQIESSLRVHPRFPDIFKLQLLSFKGFDMVSEMVHDSICQHGGFYIFYEILDWNWKERIVEDFVCLCKSITNQPEILLPLNVKLRAVYIISTTFMGYSTGHMMIHYKLRPACNGHHYVFTRCINDGFNRLYFEQERTILSRKPPSKEVEDIDKTCRVIWIIHNINDKTRVDHNCTMVNDLKMLQDTYMVGVYESKISNWILPLTNSYGSFVDHDHYNFMLNATIVKEFPANRNGKEENIVRRDKIVRQFLPNVRHLAFSTNNSVMDLHGTIIQIRLLEVRVCVSELINRVQYVPFIYVDAQFMLQRTSANIPGACYLEVLDNECTPEKEHETITHDYTYLPRSTADKLTQGDTGVSVTIDWPDHCLAFCLLNVTILENLEILPDIVRKFKWINVQRVLWRVPPTHAGFRLQIQQKCPGLNCSIYADHPAFYRQCFIHVSFTPLSTQTKYTGDQTKSETWLASPDVFGSWKDADAYCQERGLQLPSFQFYDDNIGFACPATSDKDSLDYASQAFFTGLYKKSKVFVISLLCKEHKLSTSCQIV